MEKFTRTVDAYDRKGERQNVFAHITIDVDAIAKRLASRALKAKSGKSTFMEGAVQVTITKHNPSR